MRKITLFTAAVAVLAVIGIETWLTVRTLAPPGSFASSTVNPLITRTSANGRPTSHYDDYLLVSD
jgi:hypothetical protein